MGQGEHRNEKGWESGRARGRGGMRLRVGVGGSTGKRR